MQSKNMKTYSKNIQKSIVKNVPGFESAHSAFACFSQCVKKMIAENRTR